MALGAVLGQSAGRIAGIIAARLNTACFLRRMYSIPELCWQFDVPVGKLLELNPQLIPYPFVPGGSIILLPGGKSGPRDVARRSDFTLQPTLESPNVFHASIKKDALLDRKWYPPQPSFRPADREATFGRFEYVDAPEDGADNIRITDGWDRRNIGSVNIPQLVGIPYGWGNMTHRGSVRFFKKAHEQLKGLFDAWGRAGLIRRIRTWDGAYNPRYMRRAAHIRRNLSNHSWGTAFDINAAWNKLGQDPAPLGSYACTMELVEIANQFGFFWGGHFRETRADGMHFEVAKLL